jgi:hypothetical protein
MDETMLPVADAMLLEDFFELEDLLANPGLYLAISETEAYPLLLATTIAGYTELVGERFELDGRKAITVLVPGQQDVAMNPSIGIGREFFVTALKDYNDWEEKWFREAIQNGVDAGATEIDIACEQLPDKTWQITCEDNGSGMDEDTLLNKFLVLGGTTKKEGETAGGFGKAKELLVLPWISWEIHSRSTVATGAGIQYETRQIDYRTGTRLTVVMPADQHTYDAPAIEFISKCYLPDIRFTVNGTKIRADLKVGEPFEVLEDKATAYYVKAKTKRSEMLVRATGSKFRGSLFMFNRWLGETVTGFVILELTQSSVKLLTANRDGFRDYSLRSQVDALVNRIAVDIMSATKSKKHLIKQKYQGTGKFQAEREQRELLASMTSIGGFRVDKPEQIEEETIRQIEEMLVQSRESTAQEGPINLGGVSPVMTEIMLRQELLGEEHYENVLKQLVWTPDFFLINEIENFRIPAKFKPESMTPTILKLIKVWTELCRFVLAQLNCGTTFGVGFYFAEGTFATCLHDEDGDWLMLNPLFKDKDTHETRQLNPERDEDLRLLYEIAIHECTHMADGITYHDEGFAAALTFNNAKCAPGWRKIRAISDSIKMRKASEFTNPDDESWESNPPQRKVFQVKTSNLFFRTEHAIEAFDDIMAGRVSRSTGAPASVSKLDRRGAWFLMDGYHRVLEQVLGGAEEIQVQVNADVPNIEHTGGAYDFMIDDIINVSQFAHGEVR